MKTLPSLNWVAAPPSFLPVPDRWLSDTRLPGESLFWMALSKPARKLRASAQSSSAAVLPGFPQGASRPVRMSLIKKVENFDVMMHWKTTRSCVQTLHCSSWKHQVISSSKVSLSIRCLSTAFIYLPSNESSPLKRSLCKKLPRV